MENCRSVTDCNPFYLTFFSLQCDLVDIDCEDPIPGRRVHATLVSEGLRALCGAIRDQRKSGIGTMPSLGNNGAATTAGPAPGHLGVHGASTASQGGSISGSVDPVSPEVAAKSQSAGYQTLSGVVQPDIRSVGKKQFLKISYN
jgi:hypothetical protein